MTYIAKVLDETLRLERIAAGIRRRAGVGHDFAESLGATPEGIARVAREVEEAGEEPPDMCCGFRMDEYRDDEGLWREGAKCGKAGDVNETYIQVRCMPTEGCGLARLPPPV